MPTVFDNHANFVWATLTNAPGTAGTTFNVTAGLGALFAGTPVNAVIRDPNVTATTTTAEIVRITARSTDALTVTRAQEGTTAQNAQAGWLIGLAITDKSFLDIEAAINALENIPVNDTSPADIGLKAYSFDPITSSGTSTPLAANGQIFVQKMRLDTATTVTGIFTSLQTAGATLTAGQNFAALYTAAGALVTGTQTADQTTAWASVGLKSMPFSGGAKALAAGYYYVALWANGTTRPAFVRATSGSSAINGLSPASSSRWATAANTATTTAPATLGTLTASLVGYFSALY